MKRLFLAAVLALSTIAVVGCKAPPAIIACTVAGVTASCVVDGVTVSAAIPPDVATVVGLVAPFTDGVVTAEAVTRARVASLGNLPTVTSSFNTKTRTLTLTNPQTGKSASFVVSAP